jgi:hypothetical protein
MTSQLVSMIQMISDCHRKPWIHVNSCAYEWRCISKRQWGCCYLFRGYVTARLRVAIYGRISTYTPPSIDITFPLAFPCCMSEQFCMRNGTGKLPSLVHANSDLHSQTERSGFNLLWVSEVCVLKIEVSWDFNVVATGKYLS